MRKKYLLRAALAFAFMLCLSGCGSEGGAPDYSDAENWAYLDSQKSENGAPYGDADVFFICPTVYGGDRGAPNMSLDDAETRESFVGATNMEKGIYDTSARFFAPYYRQAGLWVYSLPEESRGQYLDVAYGDIKAAFQTYLDEYGEDRPIVLAGFSQGADLSIRLMKDFFDDPELNGRLVACYAIGWRITQEELDEFPHLKTAQSAEDTGVIVSFNTEDPAVTGSLTVPEGVKTLGINPLNWRADSEPADKSLNLGACFTDYSGAVTEEIPQLTGAYLDPERGTLKVTDISPSDYPPSLDLFEEGVYHLYDYQFFYMNLRENVETRIGAYAAEHTEAAA